MIYAVIGLHFLFDWICQPRVVARNKSSSFYYLGIHLATIYVGFSLFGFYVGVPNIFIAGYMLLHGVQDKIIWTLFIRYRVPKNNLEYLFQNRYAEDYWWYTTIAVDQFLHLVPLIYIFENHCKVFQI